MSELDKSILGRLSFIEAHLEFSIAHISCIMVSPCFVVLVMT